MRFLPEEQSAALVDEELAFAAVRDALVAAAGDQAEVFPAVAGHGSSAGNRFTVKSGASAGLAGVKVGSYWPGNVGVPRHNSIVLLFDQELGRIGAVVEAGVVNAYRTAAADAVAASVLARDDAATLTVFGTGHQALYECAAVARVRPISTIHVVARSPQRGERFVASLAGRGLTGQVTAAEPACRAADIIVTATTATAPLFDAGWVRPGTHVASMGSDALGKQELPPRLLAAARLFCDLPSQSVRIGELQHVADLVADGTLRLTAIGDVLTGRAPGRAGDGDITVFDSSGIALQDLFVADALLRAAGSP
ncbi:ornithine cyclodeaminase family protein [Dactylosporangium sp. AC04546]|uniref:ornithine cyclodeaminase family protein n=1 Tax=Dactylosporangium sp. AC04546 TaxID=2862460 RepID=UPI001EE068E7|nr:ornithine cyclodeaminase family protein [Dactylosporangium sp. AC04546]WVK89199.1 ornithine cyclodeaminase family protein [Dactylosporangium sp. AC04546]